MNVVRVMGGLGNQLFQYAFGKAQMQNGIDVSFKLPTGKEVARSGTRRKECPVLIVWISSAWDLKPVIF